MAKQQLTRDEFLQLLGLLTLSSQAYRRLEECEQAIGSLLGLPASDRAMSAQQTALDHVAAHVFDSQPNAVILLDKLGIKLPDLESPALVGVPPASMPIEAVERWMEDADAAPH